MRPTISPSARSWGPVRAATSRVAPICRTVGRRPGSIERSSTTRARRSSRRIPAWSMPASRARELTRQGPAASVSSAARWRSPSRSPGSPSAARPASVSDAASERRGAIGRPAPVPVPGGSTRASPRAGVDTYSRATHSPSRTSSGGTSASSAESGSASRSGGSSDASATSTTTPSIRRPPKGTTSIDPTPTASWASANW